MSRATYKTCGRMPRSRYLLRAVGVALVSICSAVAGAADDDYVDLLDEEAAKVEGVTTDTRGDRRSTKGDAGASASASPGSSREDFETLLRRRHVGTYSFYRRLPERSREEVFVDYGKGASMEVLRGKIIDRYLHQ